MCPLVLSSCSVNWRALPYASSLSMMSRARETLTDRRMRFLPDQERELALAVINNWRSSHSFPLNTLQMNLRDTSRKFDREPTIAQRIKRLPSIRHNATTARQPSTTVRPICWCS